MWPAMSRCELTIELDRAGASYEPGEPITGTIRVRSPAGASCRSLTIWMEWQTSKTQSSCQDRGSVRGVSVFSGVWEPGTDVSYRFELEAPPGPLSYDGQLLGIEWCVAARARLAWARSCTAQEPVSLRACSDGGCVPGTGDYRSPPRVSSRAYVFGSRQPLPKPALDLSVETTFPFEGALLALGRGLRRRWGRARLGGAPTVHAPREAVLGRPFEVQIRFAGADQLELERCEVHLRGQEVVLKHELDWSVSLAGVELVHYDVRDAVRSGDHWVATLLIPRTAPPTFSGRYGDIRYNLQVECAAKGAPAWQTELPLVVRPTAPAA